MRHATSWSLAVCGLGLAAAAAVAPPALPYAGALVVALVAGYLTTFTACAGMTPREIDDARREKTDLDRLYEELADIDQRVAEIEDALKAAADTGVGGAIVDFLKKKAKDALGLPQGSPLTQADLDAE